MTILGLTVEEGKKEKPVVDRVVELYNNSESWRDEWSDDWDGYYKHYRFYRAATEHTMRSNIYVPYIFAIVESVVPKMLSTIFNASPIVSVVPREGGDEDLAFIMERFLDYAFQEEELDLYNSMETFFKEAAIYGTAFMKILPRFTGGKVPDLDYIDADPVDLYKIFPDHRARSLKKSDWIIHKDWVALDKIKEMAKQGFYRKEVIAELEQKEESYANVDEYKKDRLSGIDKTVDKTFDSKRKIIEVLEYWDREEIISVAGRDVLLKQEPNPFKGMLPFIMTTYTTVPHEFYGIGIPEMAETLQEELNDLRNQRMDNVNIIINRMFIANKYADVDFDSLVSYPGNVILADSVDAVKPLETRDITKSIYMEEERLVADIQNVTGEWEYGRGKSPERRETATGIIRLQQAANIRFDAIVKRIEFGTVRALAKLFIWYAFHFLDPAKMAKIVGEEEWAKRNGMRFYQLPAEEILRHYHFQPMGSSTSAVKELRAQQMMNLYGVFNQDPLINQYELREMLMQALDVKQISKLLKTEQQAMAEQQQMMGAPGAGGAPGPMPGPAGEPMAGEPAMAMPPEAMVQGGAPAVGAVPGAVAPGAVPAEMLGG